MGLGAPCVDAFYITPTRGKIFCDVYKSRNPTKETNFCDGYKSISNKTWGTALKPISVLMEKGEKTQQQQQLRTLGIIMFAT